MGLRVEWRGSNDRDVRWLRWLRCWSGGEAALSRTRRLAWTLVSGLLLSSLVGAYVGLISPWLEVPRRARPSSSAAADLPSGPPPENAIIAGRYLPEWALSARWQGRWGQTYFFAGRQEAIEEDAMVRFAPFALVHLPAPDAGAQPKTSQREPVVILADSAVVHFPDSVDLDDPDHIVSCDDALPMLAAKLQAVDDLIREAQARKRKIEAMMSQMRDGKQVAPSATN